METITQYPNAAALFALFIGFLAGYFTRKIQGEKKGGTP